MAAVLLVALLPLPPFFSETVVLPTASSASSSFRRNVPFRTGPHLEKKARIFCPPQCDHRRRPTTDTTDRVARKREEKSPQSAKSPSFSLSPSPAGER